MNNRLPAASLLISGLALSAAASAATEVADVAGVNIRTALPYPTRETPVPRAVGRVSEVAGQAPLSVTLTLNLRDAAGAEALFRDIYDTKSPEFHRFLTPAEFRSRFAASDAAVADVAAKLAPYGLSATRTGATTLRVTGTPAALEKAFQVNLQVYEVGATSKAAGYRFHEPDSAPKVPAEISATVGSVIGLSTRPAFTPKMIRAFDRGVARVPAPAASSGGNPPGQWTVTDFSNYYHASGLTSHGFTGKGQTVGIVTLANFTVSDAFAYWKAVGLNVAPDRVTVIPIDGGAGAPSDASGSDETTLDVEQSGGIAPDANVIVYQAPNTGQAFVDAFAKAVDDNKAESISVSWGEWEWFDTLGNSPVKDPVTGKTVSTLAAFNEIFLQASLQGQSLFAASGDAGAYDVNRGLTPPDFSLTLTVDSPSSSPYITAAGGTTLAGKQTYQYDQAGDTVTVNVKTERVWSWDYLTPLCDALKLDPFACGIFPVGSGGGVSVEFPVPAYQKGLAGIQKSQPDQSFVDYVDTIPPTVVYTLPAHFAGRNVPDLSANGDPQTGYVYYYTSSANGFGIGAAGGTSFVAPQFNGVTALLGQYLGRRIGLLNIPLYELAKSPGAYTGPNAPFHAIPSGNNDFYLGSSGYSPAAGIGTPEVYKLAVALKKAGY